MASSRFVYIAAGTVLGALGYALFQPVPTALAQIPDQGAQLQKLIDQSKDSNAKLDRLIAILEGGKLQVTVKHEDAQPAR